MALRTGIALCLTALLLSGCMGKREVTLPKPMEPTEQTVSAPTEEQDKSGEPPQTETPVSEKEPSEELTDDVTESSVEASAKDTEQFPLDGTVICLDAGHGIAGKTAQERVSPKSEETKAAYVSGASGAMQTEEELNLAVAKLTQIELERLGAQVVMTRTEHEEAVSNIERAQIANLANADLCIRIHADSADSSSARGMSMLIPSGSLLGTPEIIEPSAEAGEIILQTVTERTGANNRGLVSRSDLTGFNWSEVPCILLEMGFLSNTEEDALLAQESYRQTIAQAIAEGVCRWKNKA